MSSFPGSTLAVLQAGLQVAATKGYSLGSRLAAVTKQEADHSTVAKADSTDQYFASKV